MIAAISGRGSRLVVGAQGVGVALAMATTGAGGRGWVIVSSESRSNDNGQDSGDDEARAHCQGLLGEWWQRKSRDKYPSPHTVRENG